MSKIKRGIGKVKRLVYAYFNLDNIIYKQNGILTELERINNKLDNNFELRNEIYEIKKIVNSIQKEFDYSNLDMNKLIVPKNEKKQILICGFYGAINLGDDLMLETILDHLKKVKNIEITIMLCDKKNIDVTNYGNYNFIHYPSKTEDFSTIAKYFDAIIFGGGALLDDVDYNEDNPIFNLGYILINLILMCINYQKTTILYGLSSNKKIKNKQYIKKLNIVAKNATSFTLRDENSLNTLKAAGIDTSKIKIVDDIVLSNKVLQEISFRENSEKIKLGFVYICNSEYYNFLYDYTKKVIEYLEEKKLDYEITFIPFYNHMNNDEIIYKRLVNDLCNEKIFIESMPKKMEDIVNIFKDKQYIISMRYHATLIANFMDKNVFSINFTNHRHYFNKINYIYDHYCFEKNCINFGEQIHQNNLEVLFNNNSGPYEKDKILLKAQKDIKTYLVNEVEKL